MDELFDLSKFDEYRDDNRQEVKSAKDGLPNDLWETYSAFANSKGGVIILGIKEKSDGSWMTSGLKNANVRIKEFWDLIHNDQKVSLCLLNDNDVKPYVVGDDVVIVINVPAASREEKPIYIGTDMFKGTYRRNSSGDYHCKKPQVLAMLRDQTDLTMDMKVLEYTPMSIFNMDTVRSYQNMHKSTNASHPFSLLDDDGYLRSIGAAAYAKDGSLHPTTAGLLMFGNDYDIVREFPEYFLDFQEQLDPSLRWTDRLWSTSGIWSGNIFDFFLRAYSKIAVGLKIPFKQEGIIRIDDTPVHKAVREAMVNCLSNADYFGTRGIVIKKMPDRLILENPGSIRTGKKQMLQGGVSDPRNKVILKMFNLLDIGERSGSGVPRILNTWKDENWIEPIIEEDTDPDRTRLTLLFKKVEKTTGDKEVANKSGDKKVAIKSGDKNVAIKSGDKNVAIKSSDKNVANEITDKKRKQYDTILSFMQAGVDYRASEFEKLLGVKSSRIRMLLSEMADQGMIIAEGTNKQRVYRLNTALE